MALCAIHTNSLGHAIGMHMYVSVSTTPSPPLASASLSSLLPIYNCQCHDRFSSLHGLWRSLHSSRFTLRPRNLHSTLITSFQVLLALWALLRIWRLFAVTCFFFLSGNLFFRNIHFNSESLGNSPEQDKCPSAMVTTRTMNGFSPLSCCFEDGSVARCFTKPRFQQQRLLALPDLPRDASAHHT